MQESAALNYVTLCAINADSIDCKEPAEINSENVGAECSSMGSPTMQDKQVTGRNSSLSVQNESDD